MMDLVGAAFGVGLVIFGLITKSDNNILVGTLTAVAFTVLYMHDRKKARIRDAEEDNSDA